MIKPQQGFQSSFLSSPAQIVIGGGAAGAGKTHALLMESLRFTGYQHFRGTIFRRTTPQIKNFGGLWDSSTDMFMQIPEPPTPSEFKLTWNFPSGAKINFAHLQHEKDKYSYQGAQIPFIAFDELTHFSETQFSYMLSRNRSPFGIPSYIRATCNPDPDSWVKRFISWWIYPDDYEDENLQGMPIPSRDGVVRYFVKYEDDYIWGNTKEEVIEKAPQFKDVRFIKSLIKAKVSPSMLVNSATFIFGSVYGNRKLLNNDPTYLSNLLAQDKVEKARLLTGCWKVTDDALKMYISAAIEDLFSNSFVQGGNRYLTADIALQGSDLFVIGVWDGWRLIDVSTMEKSDGSEVLDAIIRKSNDFHVPQSHIIYDHDGVGGFLSGYSFLPNAIAFVNNARPLNKENYENLKTQCYYYLAKIINARMMYISATPNEPLIKRELEVVRKKPDDGKSPLKMSPKKEMKIKLGHSPDFADMIAMRSYFDLIPSQEGTFEVF